MSVLALFAQVTHAIAPASADVKAAAVATAAPVWHESGAPAAPDSEAIPVRDAARGTEPSPATDGNPAKDAVGADADNLIDPITGEEFAVEIRTANAGTIWLVNKKTGRFPRELTPADIRDLEGVKAAFERAWPGAPFAIEDVVFPGDPDQS